MRKLEKLCLRYNRQNQSKVVVFRVPKAQYGYKYLVRYSPTGLWSDSDERYRFDTLLGATNLVLSFFR